MTSLAKDGMTMIVVTHEMGFARGAANRVVFMSDGAIVEAAEPEGVLQQPASPTAPKTSSARFSSTERLTPAKGNRTCRPSRLRVAGAVALAVALPFAATACGGGGGGGGDTIVIGTKFDQPGLGLKNPDGTMSGFDVDVATYVAERARLQPGQDRVEGIAVGPARDADPERSGQVHRRDLLDHRRPQGEGRLRRAVPGHRAEPAGARPTTPTSPARSRCRTTRSCARCRVRRRRSASRTSTRACSCSSTTPTRRASRR